MENVLNAINRLCIALADEEKKTNNAILHRILEIIITELKNDKLFKKLYNRNFFGGSYYDQLKVGNPNEFDIDLVFLLPPKMGASVKASDKPGFVHVTVDNYLELGEEFKGFHNLVDIVTKKISAKKTLAWMEGLVTRSINKLFSRSGSIIWIEENYEIYVKSRKSGPAFNMIILAKSSSKEIKLDVDLVPCFQFEGTNWPSKAGGYRQLDRSKYAHDTFLVVPKMPTSVNPPDLYWRLSFQEQERELISGAAMGRLKPSVRLIKKIRDRWCHVTIASYYIKTVFMLEVDERETSFWQQPLKVVFLEMLRVYHGKLKKREIQYYWNKKYNLLSGIEGITLDNIANKIERIIKDIDRFGESEPLNVAKNIVSEQELKTLQNEVEASNKQSKVLCTPEESTPNNVPPKVSPNQVVNSINKSAISSPQRSEDITLVMFNKLLEEIRRLTDRTISLEKEIVMLKLENSLLRNKL